MILNRPVGLVVAALLLSACTYKPAFINEYRIDVQQGNVLTPEMVAQLKPGQTRDQVRFLLGTPLIADVFHRQRWDYVYRFREGRTGEVESRKLSVFFDASGRLERVAGDVDVATAEQLDAPAARMRVVELGAASEGELQGEPPVPAGPGVLERIWQKIGF